MKKNILKFLILILVGFLFLGALGEVRADVIRDNGGGWVKDEEGKCQYVCPSDAVCIKNPLKACSFEALIGSLIDFIFGISLAIVPLMVIIAGFYWLTAAGDPKKVKTALDIIKWTVIGFAIILFARGLVAIIRHVLGGK